MITINKTENVDTRFKDLHNNTFFIRNNNSICIKVNNEDNIEYTNAIILFTMDVAQSIGVSVNIPMEEPVKSVSYFRLTINKIFSEESVFEQNMIGRQWFYNNENRILNSLSQCFDNLVDGNIFIDSHGGIRMKISPIGFVPDKMNSILIGKTKDGLNYKNQEVYQSFDYRDLIKFINPDITININIE